MKTIQVVLLTLAAFISSKICAQDCASYLPFQKGNKIEYSMTDKKDKPSGTLQYVINDVTKSGSDLLANITSTTNDEKGKQLSTSTFTYTCNNDGLSIDMKSMLSDQSMSAYKDMTVKVEGGTMTIPYSAAPGTQLPDATMHMDILNEGKTFSTIDMKMTNRKVEAKEDVVTAAGTFPCIKISYDTEMKTETMGIGIPMVMKSVTWYSAKVGMVKSESFSKDDKPMGSMILSGINK
ncbi:MAG: hypothetical protein ACHQD9_02050 [Chitinophagales bacterium]